MRPKRRLAVASPTANPVGGRAIRGASTPMYGQSVGVPAGTRWSHITAHHAVPPIRHVLTPDVSAATPGRLRRALARTRLRAVPMAVLLAVATAFTATAPANAASLYFGALVHGKPPAPGAFSPGGPFHAFEQMSRKKMSLVQWGQPWKMSGQMQRFQAGYLSSVRSHGAIPVVNWASQELGRGLNQPAFQLRDIAN